MAGIEGKLELMNIVVSLRDISIEEMEVLYMKKRPFLLTFLLHISRRLQG